MLAVSMSYKLSTRIVALAVGLLLVTAGFACRGTQPPRESTPPPNYSSQTSTSTQSALPERRIALVVGNSRYRYVSYLKNPRNDAFLIAKALKSVGFEVIDGGPQLDLDKPALDRVIQDFGNALQGATTALFYYAGHGIEINGSNYLIPTSANPTREADVDFQMVDIETVLHQMEDGSARLNVLILDACRNNPFGGRGLRALGGGLGQTPVPQGTYIQYAAQPRAVATDGEGDDSPYSASLAKVIQEPGIDIYHALNQVGLSVQQQTGGKQVPWLSVSPVEGDFYFVKAAPTPVMAAAAGPPVAAPAWGGVPDADVVYWMSIPANTNNPEFLKSYLKEFPNGRFADLARLRLKTQQEAAIELPKPSAPSTAAESMSPSRAPTTEKFTATTKAALDREDTELVRHRLVKAGYKPHLIPTKVGDQTSYRLELGPFSAEAQANAAQKTLDEIETGPQLAMASPALPHPAIIQPSPALAQPEALPSAATYTVQSDRPMDYNDAIIVRMRVAKLGYQAHLVPRTVNGQREFGIEVGSLTDEKQAAQVRRKLDELAAESNASGSLQQPRLDSLPLLTVTTVPDAGQFRRAEQDGGPYRIHVEDTFDQSRAQMIIDRLERLGYKPQLLASREGGQTSYRIDVGGFANEDAAEAAEDELHNKYDAALATERPGTSGVGSSRQIDRPKVAAVPAKNVVNKTAPTPSASPPSEIATAYAPGKGVGIEFSSEPERLNKVNPKAYASASYYNRGNAFFAANNLDAASAQFREAVDLDPTNADAYYAWGLTLYAKRDLAGSIANFRRATSLKPSYADAYYNWGLALYDLGEIPEAMSKFEKTVELRPGYADAYYNWGLALSRTGALDRAIDKFQKATTLNREYADAYYGWGVALYHQQRYEDSIDKYRKALDLSPANQTYKIALASALTAQQNSSTAR
jgi:Tfp pilus assembly protein PilF